MSVSIYIIAFIVASALYDFIKINFLTYWRLRKDKKTIDRIVNQKKDTTYWRRQF